MGTMRHSRKEKMELMKKAAFLIVLLALVPAVAAFVSHGSDRQVSPSDSKNVKAVAEAPLPAGQEAENVVEIDGEAYIPKQNIETFLFIGVDSKNGTEGGTGQCDVLELLVFDRGANTYTLMPINRDTMTDVRSLDEDGNYLATTRIQIALAHAHGDGGTVSCENTVDAVSTLLNGQKIDKYAAMGMDAIPVINRLVGGVTVTIEDDFPGSDPAMAVGNTVTLNDEQAELFVRGRMDVGDGTNENRMKRQGIYLSALKELVKEKCRDYKAFPLTLYDGLEEYMVSDMTRNDFIKLAAALLDAEEQPEIRLEGESVIGRFDYKEFTVDEESLNAAIAALFYDKYDGGKAEE